VPDAIACAHALLLESVSLVKGIDSAVRLRNIRKAQKGFAGLFRRQGDHFMRGFPRFVNQFPQGGLQEALREDVDALFDDVFDSTAKQATALMASTLFEGAKDGYVAQSASFGLDTVLSMKSERALTWARSNASARVTRINESTREEIKGMIVKGLEEGTSYGQVARDIKGRFEEFAEGQPQEHISSRAELVAVTENSEAFEEGGLSLARDVEEAGIEMEKAWLVAEDERLCEICETNGQTGWIPLDEQYPDGSDHPPAHPACILPGNDIVLPGISTSAAKSFYEGRCVEVTLANGRRFSVTENHPVLGLHGWVPAKFLRQGDHVVGATLPERIAASISPDHDYGPSRVEEVFEAVKVASGMASARVPASAEDLHGEGASIQGDIEVVFSDGTLQDSGVAVVGQPRKELTFNRHDTQLTFVSSLGGTFLFSGGLDAARSRHMCGGGSPTTILLGGGLRPQPVGFGYPAWRYPGFEKADAKTGTRKTGLLREFLFRFSCDVTPQEVIHVRDFSFSGHVFDLQCDPYGLYICNGVVVKNCRCAGLHRMVGSEV
jgi:hypothetical protein